MQNRWVFDMPHAKRFTEARQEWLRTWLPDLQKTLNLSTALDVGCGVGHFSTFLREMGFEVIAFDGRPENVAEARRRYSDIEFLVANIEDRSILTLGTFDLVLCFGLIYHLENPFVAIRNLYAITGKVLLIESMVVSNTKPVLILRDEGREKDQSLGGVAFYPSEAALVKICYQAGFSRVYRCLRLPRHEDFQRSFWRRQARTVVVASKLPVELPILRWIGEPRNWSDPWLTPVGRCLLPARRLWLFLQKPQSEKAMLIRRIRGMWRG